MGVAQAGTVIRVDTGGTFTDVILLDPMNGRVVTAKTPIRAGRPIAASSPASARRSIRRGWAGTAIQRVLHGTTVATNLIRVDRAFRRFGSRVVHNRSKGRGAAQT